MSRVAARLCTHCGIGAMTERCIKCKSPARGKPVMASLCNACGVVKKDHCIRCGQRIAGAGVEARYCPHCAPSGEGACPLCGGKV